MADFGKKVQSDNKHLEDLANAKFLNVTAAGSYVVSAGACNLGRVILNTNGGTVEVRSGSRPIGIIALDAPEGSFDYGVYCENGLTVDVVGTCDATIVFN